MQRAVLLRCERRPCPCRRRLVVTIGEGGHGSDNRRVYYDFKWARDDGARWVGGCGSGRQLSEAKLAEEKRSRGWNDPPPNIFPASFASLPNLRECSAMSAFWPMGSVANDAPRLPRRLELSNVGTGE